MTTQYWITGTLGDWSTAADWQSGVVPSSTNDAVINSSVVTVNGTAVAYSLVLNGNYSQLILSGTLTLGTSLTVDGNSQIELSGGLLSAQSITYGNYGYLSGYGTVSGALSGDIAIIAIGGTLMVQGSLAGDTGSFAIVPGATLELSNGSANGTLFEGTFATLKLDTPNAFSGSINSVVVGDTIDLAGVTVSSATYNGSALTINESNGQQLNYNVSGSVAGDILTVASDNNGGTFVYWVPPESWISGRSGDWSMAANWLSSVVPISTDDVLINNSNTVTVNGTAVANSLILDTSTLTVSGTLTLGSLVIDGGAEFALSGGTLSAGSIRTNTYGYLSGYGTVSGEVAGAGDLTITANGGTLNVQALPWSGEGGSFLIDQGATLEFMSGVVGAGVAFNSNIATLKLETVSVYISNFAVGDMIDLVGIAASSGTYKFTNEIGAEATPYVALVNETNGQQLSLNSISGPAAYVGDNVIVASDNNGGALVFAAPSPVTNTWITGTAGDWSTAADWVSGVVPVSTDDVVINNLNAVTINGTAVAHSLLLDNSTLTVSGTLTLGTSLDLEISQLTLSGGTLSAQSIISYDGTIYGYGTVNSALSGYTSIFADGGTLKFEGSLLEDSGVFQINSGAALELSNGTAASINFNDNIATLKLDTPAAFTGSISNITAGDMIDLAGITANSATYNGTTLTINETNGHELTYNVTAPSVYNASGQLAGDSFLVASDNNGGTLVFAANPLPTQATTIQQEIAGLYAAVYDRAADSFGMQYWVNVVAQQADALGITYSAAANTPISTNDAALLGQLFVATQSTYFNQTYGNLNDTDFVNALYFNIGGQNAESPSSIAYWVNTIQNEEASGLSVQNARAAVVGQFVHDLIDVNLAQWTTILTPSELETTILRQAVVDNKVAVSLAYVNASANLGGSILNAHAVGDAGFQAEVRALGGVAIDPFTATVQITGINNAVANQSLADIQPV